MDNQVVDMPKNQETVMQVMRVEDAPAVTTPNAVMRTYASPATNGAAVAVWRTEMAGGAHEKHGLCHDLSSVGCRDR